jgi:hypothetical protein
MKRRLLSRVLGVAAALVLWTTASDGVVARYVEDFTTTQYKDSLITTAWWDTDAGELKLFPFVPALVGSYDTPGNARGVFVSGDHLFVADFGSGLHVVDITDPTAPTLLGTYNTPGSALGVYVTGDYAFVADYGSGLQVIDITDPAAPSLLGTCDTPGLAVGVFVAGDLAFVADYDEGFQVIDISDPTTPWLGATYDTPGNALGVFVTGDLAFVADDGFGLQVIDITAPPPTLLGSYDTPGNARGVYVTGDLAFVADDAFGLQVIDVTDVAAPSLLGTFVTPGNAWGVFASGDLAYVADYDFGLQVIDITDPAIPSLLEAYDTPGIARGVFVSGDLVFMADGGSGVQLFDIREVAAPPVSVGSYSTPDWAYGVFVAGDHAFVADHGSGLQVFDISNPAAPSLVGTYDPIRDIDDVFVSGDHAFLNADSALQVVDISDPTAPSLLGTYTTPSGVTALYVSGDLAFLGVHTFGLAVIDVSQPIAPSLLGAYDTPGTALGVFVAGDYAFVADGNPPGFLVIDVSDPTAPSLAGTCDVSGANRVVVAGDHAIVACNAGLAVIDIGDPTAPTLLGTYDSVANNQGVYVSGDLAFLAKGPQGLLTLDISDPTAPSLLGTYDTPGSATDVYVAGDLAFLADTGGGLQVFQVFQREVDPFNNVGQSLAVDASTDTIIRARITTTQTSAVTWELSADGGLSWQGIEPDGSWNQVAAPGDDLLWRSKHTWRESSVNPTVTQLEIDWLYEMALIDSIVDVPGDQGGWIYANFTRSSHDFLDEVVLPISYYGIWRRLDDPALVATLNAEHSSTPEKNTAGETPEFGGLPVVTYQGGTYILSQPDMAAPPFPPGTWAWVATVPAIQQDTYIAAVPTAADSLGLDPNHTVLVITAHTTTPSIWYISEPDSGYSVDNIAPTVPTGFTVAYNTGVGNQLSWDPCPDADFQYFRVYRSTDPEFVPTPADSVHSTIGTNWTDPDYDGWNVHYKITALDYVGNESDPASSGTVTAVTEPVIPQTYTVYQNVPNPFNPATVIHYDVPVGQGKVTIRIYDVSGRLVRTLLDDPQSAGRKTIIWTGRDDEGQSVASGVYFYRMTASGFEKTRKMVLLR